MKAVLLSVQPKFCGLIASGKKTIEVRKTRPMIGAPFKCYIDCTQGGDGYFYKTWLDENRLQHSEECIGKVIGEFVCDDIDEYRNWSQEFSDKSCLSLNELVGYANPSKYPVRERFCLPIYGWHITDLKIYDKPKELGEFKKPCDVKYKMQSCNRDCEVSCIWYKGYLIGDDKGGWKSRVISCPPQSWCYVEENEVGAK